VFGTFVGLLALWHKLHAEATKEKISCYIMGIENKNGRRRRSHSILRTDGFTSLEDYYKNLRRDKRQTFAKITNVFTANGITVETKTHHDIGFSHFLVILSHQLRVHGMIRGFFSSVMRFLSVNLMVGTLDHFYANGTLVAFSHTIIKGDTERAMWFYQKSEVSKCLIWFYHVQKAIARAISTPGVKYVDLGPSINSKVKEMKETMNFEELLNWKEVCDYSGSFKTPVDVNKNV